MSESTRLLMMCLDLSISRKTEARIRERVSANKCLCCDNAIWRNGNCRSCDSELNEVLSEMSDADRVTYIAKLVRLGRRLEPYQIRKYRKPVSIFRKLAT